MASLRGALRFVGFELPYSRLRLAKPVAPSGRPTLPATLNASPSPSPNVPVSNSRLPPEAASLSWKFRTPAMASEPYCAAAPSRNTSTWRSAMDGMAEMSAPCEPYATPLPPCQSMIDERWRRLPFTQHQRVVGRQVAQHRRPHDSGSVADWLRVDVERRDDRPQLVLQIDHALVGQIGGRQHVDRHRRCGDGPRPTARTDDDGLLREPVEQHLQLVRRQAQRPDFFDRHAERVAERFVLFGRQVFLRECRRRYRGRQRNGQNRCQCYER